MARGGPLQRLHDGFVPGRHLVDAYGNGGFRFADMSHRGSILAYGGGVHAWSVARAADITPESLDVLIKARAVIDVVIIGTGSDPIPIAERVRWTLRDAGLRHDVMATGAAARTYNVMLGENRRVACALIAVD